MKRKEDYLNELKNKNISEHSKLILENQITISLRVTLQ